MPGSIRRACSFTGESSHELGFIDDDPLVTFHLACVSAKNLSISTLETSLFRSALDGLSRPRLVRRTTDMYETPKIPAVSRSENASLGISGTTFCFSATFFICDLSLSPCLPLKSKKHGGIFSVVSILGRVLTSSC